MTSSLEERQRRHVLYTWTAQNKARGLVIEKAQGAEFWTEGGKRWIDFESQVYNAHLGHGDMRVIRAIQEQAEQLAVAHPAAVYETKARLGERLAEVTPEGINRFFLALGGAEANENALKIARLVSGRHKVISRYNSYHGATYGALTLTGDSRRFPFEPGIPGVIKVHPPDSFRGPGGLSPQEWEALSVDLIRQTVLFENPESIAALFVEPIGGAIGGYMPSPAYMQGLRSICDEFGILLVADEVLTGFGRTGKWFAVEHSDVKPDMIVMAKGLTAGYAPLGVLGMTEEIAQHFDEEMLWAGLTSYGHPLACAAALATIDVMESDGLIERSARLGTHLNTRLQAMVEDVPVLGQARVSGLYGVLEFVEDKESARPLVPEWAAGSSAQPTARLRELLWDAGLHMAVKGPRAFIAPPLSIEQGVLDEGLDRLHTALQSAF